MGTRLIEEGLRLRPSPEVPADAVRALLSVFAGSTDLRPASTRSAPARRAMQETKGTPSLASSDWIAAAVRWHLSQGEHRLRGSRSRHSFCCAWWLLRAFPLCRRIGPMRLRAALAGYHFVALFMAGACGACSITPLAPT